MPQVLKIKKIDTAIFLTCGLGKRLRPLTADRPKPMVEVNGKSILERALKILEINGIKQSILVVGYKRERIKEKIGTQFGKMKIIYIDNEHDHETNNTYTLWLARKYLEQGAYIVEDDILFDEEIFKKITNLNGSIPHWAAVKFTDEFDGALIKTDEKKDIKDVIYVEKSYNNNFKNSFKSIGIVRIPKNFGIKFSSWLDEEVKNKNLDTWYDYILGKHIKELPFYVCDITGSKWFEIDTVEDFKKAEKMFN